MSTESSGQPRVGLERLLRPLALAEFLHRCAAGEATIVHGAAERLPQLFQLPALASAERVLEACTGASVTAMLPDRKDESHSLQVTADAALKLYRSGMNLSVGSAQRFFPELAPWVENLRVDLGLPPGTFARCIVYLSPAGGGAPPHFDPNINFSLQLRGRKVWRVARNRSVDHPTERHVLGDPVCPTLLAQAHAAFPAQMPADSQTVELRPGSLLSFRVSGASEACTRHIADVLATTIVVRYALSFDGLVTKVNHHQTVSEYFTTPAQLARNGFDRLIRLGIGLENADDLLAALNWALHHAGDLSTDDVAAWQQERMATLGVR